MPYIKTNIIRLYYEITGKGKAVIFLHGYTGSCKDWKNQLSLLPYKYKAIAVDHRGHGQSEAPHKEEEYSIYSSVSDIYNLLVSLGIPQCCLVGHSMGGFMALQFALDYPDLVNALILVDTSSGNWDVPPGYDKVRATLDDLARNKGLDAAFEFDVENNPAKKEKFRNHPELLDIARQKVKTTSVDGYIYFARAFKRWSPVTDRLNEIAVPTLIVLGEEDIGFVNASHLLRDSIQNAELITIPDAGHNPHEEAPEIFNAYMLDFLNKNV